MIPKKNRATSEIVSEAFKKGKIITSNALFSCRFLYSSSPTPNIAFIAPKTIFKTAVERSNIRRKWYSSLPKNIKNIKPGVYTFILKDKSSKINSEERIKNLLFLLK